MAFYSSYGGAGEVTGSCHLLQIGYLHILIDCGMFQGKEEELNFEPFGFDPKDIDYLIVTHAHLDHIGRIPLLVKNGFKGEIISTRATYELACLMLKNSASILQEKPKVLYNESDVQPALEKFTTFLEYGESLKLNDHIKIAFKNAGHILGSATLKVSFKEDGIKKSCIFSGDIGQHERIITSKLQPWKKASTIFLESTYGDRLHQSLQLSIDEFKKSIVKTVKNGGVVVLPSFALERTQEILYLIKGLSKEGLIQGIPVFLDAPLAINVTKIFLKHPTLLNDNIQTLIESGENPFEFDELRVCYSKEESMHINETKGAKIIIAGSGMCEGGRVKYHLSRYLSDEKNLILFIGYQVGGTLGRKILQGESRINIGSQTIPIKANIDVIDGFSAHADQHDLLSFVKKVEDSSLLYLIHGDHEKLHILKSKVQQELQDKVHIVKMKEKIYI